MSREDVIFEAHEIMKTSTQCRTEENCLMFINNKAAISCSYMNNLKMCYLIMQSNEVLSSRPYDKRAKEAEKQMRRFREDMIKQLGL